MALLSVADALARVIEGVTPLPAEEVPLAEAEGRVLAEDLAARRTQPPHDVSAMDGYAVRTRDFAGTAPYRLPVRGESRTGAVPDELAAGAAMRIFTGATFGSVTAFRELGDADYTFRIRPAGQEMAVPMAVTSIHSPSFM